MTKYDKLICIILIITFISNILVTIRKWLDDALFMRAFEKLEDENLRLVKSNNELREERDYLLIRIERYKTLTSEEL